MKMMYSAAALVAALGLATTSLAQSTGKAGPRPRQAKHKLTFVPVGPPIPADQPEYYPVGQHGPIGGDSLRSPSIVYNNTTGGYGMKDTQLLALPPERKQAREYFVQERAEQHLSTAEKKRAAVAKSKGFETLEDSVDLGEDK